MSGWLAIGLVVAGLASVALVILISDIARGDIGGRHTLSRARRILVVATDDETAAAADRWITEQHEERPDLQCFLLVEKDGEELFQAVNEVRDRESPDTIVFARHVSDRRHAIHTGTLARLQDQGAGPIDFIYAEEEVPA